MKAYMTYAQSYIFLLGEFWRYFLYSIMIFKSRRLDIGNFAMLKFLLENVCTIFLRCFSGLQVSHKKFKKKNKTKHFLHTIELASMQWL